MLARRFVALQAGGAGQRLVNGSNLHRAALLSSATPATSASSAAAGGGGQATEIKCVECGGVGHKAKDCPKAAGTAKRNVQDFFKQGKCLLCGQVGHEAKSCPTVGGHPEEGKPLVAKPPKPSLAERNAEKVCLQCGVKGHVMRDCPTNPSNVKIKGIRNRYSGSRLQKMLPELLKEPKSIGSAHEAFTRTPPKFGVVVSTSAQKTIGVLVQRTITHPLLKIPLDRSKKFLVHDENEQAVCGDLVLIQQTIPISKNKHFALKEIVLSLNERKENIAKRVQEAKKVYDNINEEAVSTLEKLRKSHLDRIASLKKQELVELQAARARITSEMNERLKDIGEIVDEADKDAAKRTEQWLQQMKRKLDSKDQWVKAVEEAEAAARGTVGTKEQK